MRLVAMAALGILGANELALRSFHPPLPSPDSIRLAHGDAVEAVGLMSLGMRRLAADLAFIRLLMYYGSASEPAEDDHGAAHGPGDGHGHGAGSGREREHLELLPRTQRILDLDPYFEYATLYSAGALAFNQRRPQEALTVLRHATARDPRNWKYHAQVAAVGFTQKGDLSSASRQLEPIVEDPACPTMLVNMLAFMKVRLGRRDDAVRLYRKVLRSRDKDYHEMARRALERLGAAPEP